MKVTKESLKWPQIDAAFRYMIDNNLHLAVRDATKPVTAIFEFGTGKGNSTKKICDYLKDNDMQHVHVFSFDTFQGLPSDTVEVFEKYVEGAYKVNSEDPVGDVYELADYDNLHVFKCKFNEVHKLLDTSCIGTTLLVHVDADLYTSTKEALTFLVNANLLQPGTLIAYDEFTVGDFVSEEMAHYEVIRYPGFDDREVYRSIYFDKDTDVEITQSVWEIL